MTEENREPFVGSEEQPASDATSLESERTAARARRRAQERERVLVERIEELEREQRGLRNQLALEEWRRSSVTKRKWWRLGAALGEVRSSQRQMLRLPGKVARIVSGESELPPKPKPLPRTRSSVPQLLLEADSVHALRAARRPSGDGLDTIATDVRSESKEPPQVHPRRDLAVATLVDEFSLRLLEHEFQLTQITPENWADVLATTPSMLFVESSWRGEDDAWLGRIAREEGPAPEFAEMVAGFRDAVIPTVFWNKEDPPNYDLYIGAARLFDFVFTVSEECIPRYVDDLGHDRVFLLPFSIQPKVHNPTSVGERVGDVAFAGTYYTAKHPERAEQMEVVFDPALEFDLMIFSRVPSAGRYRWPERFEPAIVGSLPYTDMLAVYKMFKVFTNVNSVVDSQSMCARRIFELAASGTPVVSGVSPAIDRYFGDIVTQVSNADEARWAFRGLLNSEEMRSRTAVRGVRTVMRDHTASLRVDQVLAQVGIDAETTPEPPAVTIVVPTNRPDRMAEVMENVGRQRCPRLQLVVATHGFEAQRDQIGVDRGEILDEIVLVPVAADRTLGDVLNAGLAAADGDFIARMDDDDYYGQEYVGDLIDAFSYTDAGIVGKKTRYTYVEGLDAMVLRFPGFEHTSVDFVAGSTMVVERSVLEAVRFDALGTGEDTRFLREATRHGIGIYSADRYNYLVRRHRDSSGHTFAKSDVELVSDGELVQFGLNLDHVTV